MQHTSFLLTVLFLAGCAPAYVQHPPLIDHPANPDAEQVSYVTPPDVRAMSMFDTKPAKETRAGMNRGEMAGMNHGGMAGMNHGEMTDASPMPPQDTPTTTLPDETTEPLKQLLDAYQAIGERLASDAIEGIADQAHKIGPAVDALVKVDRPDNPHIWHMHADDLRTIREQALALAQAGDLGAARTAYHVLSDAMERLTTATGVPDGYEKPVSMNKQHPKQGGHR